MFFYEFNNLDNFINMDLRKKLTEEMNRIQNIISIYESKKETLSTILNDMIAITNYLDEKKSDDFIQAISLLKKSFEDLENIHQFSNILESTLKSIFSLCEQKNSVQNADNLSPLDNEIKANLVEYNKQDEKFQYEILDYEKNTTQALKIALPLTFSEMITDFPDNNLQNNSSKKILNDNPILLISEKEQKAFLPYHYCDIKEYYQKHKGAFSSIEDVVNKLYVLPLNRFKNSSFSRFREAFYLIRNKENGSIAKALDLGLELMFHYDLNPIVIAACRNLDELDIYLDCLQENELSDFDCFEIKFELAPKVI